MRHAAERVKREQALSALRADVVLRLDGRATGRLPAFSASVAIAAPSRVRVQARALLGVALDLGVRGDSLFVRIPSERAAFVLDRAAESLGIGPPPPFSAAPWAPRGSRPPRRGGPPLRIPPLARGLARRGGLARDHRGRRAPSRARLSTRGARGADRVP